MPKHLLSQANVNEHQAFQRLTESLAEARDSCLALARLRADQQYKWEQVAALIATMREQTFDMVGQGELRS